MKGKILTYILVLLLAADVFYSFVQHYHMSLDGDFVFVVLPSDGCKRVLNDPFGFGALKGEHYVNPNRYFAHASMYAYFNSVPIACQLISSPVDSLYLSCAFAKIAIQLFMLWLLCVYVTGSLKIKKRQFLISAALITPLFQTWGFGRYLGIIDESISYTFFYALPLALLMLYFLPLYLSVVSKQSLKINPLTAILLVVLAIVIAFNGPLPSPVAIIISCLFICYTLWKLYKASLHVDFLSKAIESVKLFPKKILFFLCLISLLATYSFYVGTFNTAWANEEITLIDRYLLLPKGLYHQISDSIGTQLLILMIGINCIILLIKRKSFEAKSLLNRLKWIIIFSLIYILLMPLGGYRAYRPFIIRYDTFMPVNLCMIYFYGISTLYIITQYKLKLGYYAIIIPFLVTFTWVDQNRQISNKCEKEALETLAQSSEKIVFIKQDCAIMYWRKITNYNDSRYNTRYLKRMGIIAEEKYYYQK